MIMTVLSLCVRCFDYVLAVLMACLTTLMLLGALVGAIALPFGIFTMLTGANWRNVWHMICS